MAKASYRTKKLLAPNLKAPNTKDAKFDDVVKSAENAAVFVLVY